MRVILVAFLFILCWPVGLVVAAILWGPGLLKTLDAEMDGDDTDVPPADTTDRNPPPHDR